MLQVARVTSMVFTPFSIPFLSFLVLFLFSYLRIMPIQYKLIVLGIVYCFTILTPTITIFLFRKINGFARQELSERKKRYVPILLTIISYVFCLLMMRKLNIPWYMTGIIFVSLVISIICILVNLKWKLSEHMAGMGGIIGGLVSFSALFSYNPVVWLCLFILIAGILGSAQGFIDAVKQRQNTLMTTMQAIIDLQRPFFLEGDESLLKPMILKDVAERTGLDISTISRVSNSKYVQTNFGIYPLKFFFSDGYTTEDGEEMSVREIRKILKECIDGEDKKKPLTDDELADILKEKGYPIARRTVAKYRQQLNIPVARLRK